MRCDSIPVDATRRSWLLLPSWRAGARGRRTPRPSRRLWMRRRERPRWPGLILPSVCSSWCSLSQRCRCRCRCCLGGAHSPPAARVVVAFVFVRCGGFRGLHTSRLRRRSSGCCRVSLRLVKLTLKLSIDDTAAHAAVLTIGACARLRCPAPVYAVDGKSGVSVPWFWVCASWSGSRAEGFEGCSTLGVSVLS